MNAFYAHGLNNGGFNKRILEAEDLIALRIQKILNYVC